MHRDLEEDTPPSGSSSSSSSPEVATPVTPQGTSADAGAQPAEAPASQPRDQQRQSSRAQTHSRAQSRQKQERQQEQQQHQHQQQQQPATLGWASEDDWAKHRELITRMYRDENNSLKTVMQFMQDTHAFRATPKMYKRRFKVWNVEKNIKTTQIIAVMASKEYKNDHHQPSVFNIDGRQIDATKFKQAMLRRIQATQRMQARMRRSEWSLDPDASDAARAVQQQYLAETAVPLPLLPPEELARGETVTRLIHSYVDGSFDSGTWVVAGKGWDDFKSIKTTSHEFDFYQKFRHGLGLVQDGFMRQGFKVLDQAMAALTQTLSQEHPLLLIDVLEQITACKQRGRPELGTMLSFNFYKLCTAVFGPAHPMTRIARELHRSAGAVAAEPFSAAAMDATGAATPAMTTAAASGSDAASEISALSPTHHTSDQSATAAYDVFRLAALSLCRQFHGYLLLENQGVVLEVTRQLSRICTNLGLAAEGEALLRGLLDNPAFAALCTRSLILEGQSILGWNLYDQGKYVPARAIADEVLEQYELFHEAHNISPMAKRDSLWLAALCEYEMPGGSREKGTALTLEYFRFAEATWGPENALTLRALQEYTVRSGDESVRAEFEERLRASPLTQ